MVTWGDLTQHPQSFPLLQAVLVSVSTKPRAAKSPLPQHALFGQTGRKETTEKNMQFLSGWWLQIFFYFHPYLGKIPILTNIFSDGLKPPTSYSLQKPRCDHFRWWYRGTYEERVAKIWYYIYIYYMCLSIWIIYKFVCVAQIQFGVQDLCSSTLNRISVHGILGLGFQDPCFQGSYNTPRYRTPQAIRLANYERNSFIACW